VVRRQRAPGVAGIGRIAERGAGTEGDVGEIELVSSREARDLAAELLRVVELERCGSTGREGHIRVRGPEQLQRIAAGDREVAAARPG